MRIRRSTCRHCHRDVLWLGPVAKGKRPVDPEPDAQGRYRTHKCDDYMGRGLRPIDGMDWMREVHL